MVRIETTSFKHQVSLELAGNPLFLIPYQLLADGRTVFATDIAAPEDEFPCCGPVKRPDPSK